MSFFGKKNNGSHSAPENAEPNNTSKNAQVAAGKEKRSFGSLWAKIICVLAAILVWFYVSGEQSISYEKEFYNIGVSFDSMASIEKQGYTIISGDNATVDVVVSGTRSEVNSIKLSEIIAKCDLSNIYAPGEYTVPLNCETPGNTSVISITPESLVVYVDKSTQKEIPVIPKVTTGGTADLSMKIEELEPSFDTVRVTGPDEELAKISHAATDIALDGLIEKSTEWTGELYLVDKDGGQYSNAYVKLDKTTVKVLVPVNKYKTVPVVAAYEGPGAEELGHEVSLSVKTVEIRGNKDIIDTVEHIETESVDISDITGVSNIAAELAVPPGVELTEGMPETVTLSIVPHNNNSAVITTRNIVMINIPEGFSAMLETEHITVEFTGTTEALSRIKPENVYAVADLSACDAEERYEVSLDIRYPGTESVKLGGRYSCAVVLYK